MHMIRDIPMRSRMITAIYLSGATYKEVGELFGIPAERSRQDMKRVMNTLYHSFMSEADWQFIRNHPVSTPRQLRDYHGDFFIRKLFDFPETIVQKPWHEAIDYSNNDHFDNLYQSKEGE